MTPPESSRGSRIPSLSWESVVDDVDDESNHDPQPPSATVVTAPTVEDAAPTTEPAAEPAVEPAPGPVASAPEPITFETTALDPSPSEPISFAPMELSTPARPAPPDPAESVEESAPIEFSIPPLGSTIPVLGDLTEHDASPPAVDPRPSGQVPDAASAEPAVATPEPPGATPESATVPEPPAAPPESATPPEPPAGTPDHVAATSEPAAVEPTPAMVEPKAAAVSPAPAPPTPTASEPPPVPSAPEPATPEPPRTRSTPDPRPSGRTTITPRAVADTPTESAPDTTSAATAAPSVATLDAAVAAPEELPTIREATPVPDVAPAAPAPDSPALPNVAVPVPAAPVPVSTPAPVQPTPTRTAPGHKRSRRGLTLLFTLALLSALVAGALVFGPRYLFPDDWSATARPYADAVENVRGVEITEPVAVTAEPVGAYDTRAASELVGERADEQAQWRALGLLSGSVDVASVSELLSGWTSASYSTVDGQVYHDDALAGAELDSALTESMAAAAVDQEFRWSMGQGERSLDDASLVRAEVLRQSRFVRSASEFSAPLPDAAPSTLLFLPPVLGYEAMAPTFFAEFALSAETGDPADVVADGTNPLGADGVELAPAPTMIPGDTVLSSPEVRSRSFWFLVLGAYLDSRSAYDASEAIVENALTVAQRTATQCAYGTFAGGDVGQTARLRGALERWVAAAPAELSASFSVLPDGTLQMSSCDPGVGFDNPVRGGVARELIGWRVAELTTVEAVRAADGGAEDLARSWAAVEASSVGVDLGALPGETVASDLAEAARAGVTAVFFPEG